jgi:uncharacterized membrane protein
MLIAGIVALVAVLVIACVDMTSAAVAATYLAAFTLPWNGWLVGGERFGDLFILVALVLFMARSIHSPLPRLPLWLTQLGAVIIVVAILHQILPIDAHYLASRVVVAADGTPVVENQSNVFVAFKFVVAIIALPAVFVFALRRRSNAAYWIAVWFAGGASISGLIAFTDGRGLTKIGQSLTGNQDVHTREGGLSNHPNFLAAGCVVAIPIIIWLLASRDRRSRIVGALILPGVVLGTYASGSRGGAVCLVIGAVITVALLPGLRRALPAVALLAGTLAVGAFMIFPALGHDVLKATRLGSNTDTAGSNAVRAVSGAQGGRDFRHSPIDGVGFQVAAEAQNVYLQELASGGLLLFLSMQVFTLGGFWTAIRLRRDDDLANALLAALIAAAVLNYFEADLTDRFFYVPAALVAAMASTKLGDDDERRRSAAMPGPATVPTLRLPHERELAR